MRSPVLVAPLLILAACGTDPVAEPTGNDATRPEATAISAPQPENAVATPAPEQNATAPDQDMADEPGADAAVAVIERYFAALGAGDYRRAWLLWDDGGAASGMGADEFADSFRRYASISAETGTPGRIEAGAGNRYITIPVTVTGRLKDGDRVFRMEGPVTLHRNGNIPGTTPEDRSWRISASDLDARPPQ
jgi:hypothetical protein